MPKDKRETKINPLPTLSGLKRPSIFSGGKGMFQKGTAPKSFIPQTFRVTQHKGGGGK